MSAARWSPPPIRGVRWHEHDPLEPWCYCVFDEATPATAAQLVAAIPTGGSLQFYDYLYHGEPPRNPRASVDYGAIFVMHRLAPDELAIECGNHGWSSRWQRARERDVVEFLWQARASNVGNDERSAVMLVRSIADWLPKDVALDGDLLVRKDLYRDHR